MGSVKIVDTAITARWEGDYFDRSSKIRLKVESPSPGFVNSGVLSVNGNHLRALSDSVFVYNGTEYRFHGLGDQVFLTLRSAGVQDRGYEKVRKMSVSLKGLEEFVGTYYSKELDVKYTVAMKDYSLWVKTPRNEAAELMPFIRDVFTGPFVMEILRDKKGKVSGFLVSTGRSRGIRFEKI